MSKKTIHSGFDTRGRLYVACSECVRGGNGDQSCGAGWRILTLPDGQKYKLDITHRMLTAKELAAATGFPAGYRFFGGDTAAKKQIGNAVCPDLAAALYRAFLAA